MEENNEMKCHDVSIEIYLLLRRRSEMRCEVRDFSVIRAAHKGAHRVGVLNGYRK
jgi:hypothetical protein